VRGSLGLGAARPVAHHLTHCRRPAANNAYSPPPFRASRTPPPCTLLDSAHVLRTRCTRPTTAPACNADCTGTSRYPPQSLPAPCGLLADGTVTCSGLNDDGQAKSPPGTFTKISAGTFHTCGLRADGSVACWGYDADGESNAPPGTFT
jgi:hypothetical protein